MTNNEVELLGVVHATKLGRMGDIIITDSMNSIHWIKNRICKARPDLKPKAIEAFDNLKKKGVILIHKSREVNLAGQYIEFVLQK